MVRVLKSHDLSFQAEVVAILEQDGRRVVRVLIRSFSLDIDAGELADVHLGDTVLFNQNANWRPAPETQPNREREPGGQNE